jgi:hypothetical protein
MDFAKHMKLLSLASSIVFEILDLDSKFLLIQFTKHNND